MTFPGVPLVNQFTHGTLESDTLTPALNTQVDGRLNAIRSYILGLGATFPRFRDAYRLGSAVANGQFVGDTHLEDTHSAYNTTTGTYTVPQAGLYLVSASARQSTNATSFQVQIRGVPVTEYGSTTIEGPCCALIPGGGSTILPMPFRFAGGEALQMWTAVQTGAPSYMSSAGDPNAESNYWTVHQVAW